MKFTFKLIMQNIKSLLIFLILCEINLKTLSEKVKIVNLNNWTLSNENGTIQVHKLRTPTGVYSALKDQYGSFLHSTNDVNLKWLAYNDWIFSTTFSVTLDQGQRLNLTLHGIDTVSSVYLNNQEIGKTDNMFVRHSFDISPYLQLENKLEIKLKSPVIVAKERAKSLKEKGFSAPPDCPHESVNGECHRNMLRKMQSSFGGRENAAVLSMGIWKPVNLEFYEVAILRDVDVATRPHDTHWILDMRMSFSSNEQQTCYCEVNFIAIELLDNPIIFNQTISANSLQIDFKVDIPKEKVELWWPNGYGKQKLYPLYFSSNCYLNKAGPRLKSRTKSEKIIDIGFRTIELEENLDEFGRSFFFKVNNQPIFVKGVNYVPSDMLPESSYNENKLMHLIKSARETNLNMIRVWGGGFYESDTFYNLTDFFGILVWQDLAFTSATYPVHVIEDSVFLEAHQNAMRLAYHPSLCLFVTNDEIELYLTRNKSDFGGNLTRLEDEYKQTFNGSIRNILNAISRSDFKPRAGPMISTPSMGVVDSRNKVLLDPQNPNFGDVHFWENEKDGWDPDIYPRARFVTEYGFQSLPALCSWKRTMHKDDDLASIVKHRQHDPKGFEPMKQLIHIHFPKFPINKWENHIEILIYLSQLLQAKATKTATDVFRSHRTHKRTMGAIYWHLNDNWVAPSTASIDYFGNYKMVWNWSKEFMAPTIIIALMDKQNLKVNVTVTKEELFSEIGKPETFNITMYTFLWSELFYRRTSTWEVSMSPNGIYTEYLDTKKLFTPPFTLKNCFFKFELTQNGSIISNTYLLPDNVANSTGLADPQLSYELTSSYCLKTMNVYFLYYTITITVKKPALYVYIEVDHLDVEKYKLSDNGIIITEPIKVIQLQIELKLPECIALTKENIRVMTANEILLGKMTNNDTNIDDITHQVGVPKATAGIN